MYVNCYLKEQPYIHQDYIRYEIYYRNACFFFFFGWWRFRGLGTKEYTNIFWQLLFWRSLNTNKIFWRIMKLVQLHTCKMSQDKTSKNDRFCIFIYM